MELDVTKEKYDTSELEFVDWLLYDLVKSGLYGKKTHSISSKDLKTLTIVLYAPVGLNCFSMIVKREDFNHDKLPDILRRIANGQ